MGETITDKNGLLLKMRKKYRGTGSTGWRLTLHHGTEFKLASIVAYGGEPLESTKQQESKETRDCHGEEMFSYHWYIGP
jgi:hypothetical protein